MKRMLLLCAALAAPLAASAQSSATAQPLVQVEGLAPQLIAFAGGETNLANLVNGLAFGLPVTLSTTVSPGVTQVVSFTPAGTMSPVQIAQTLEAARQALIARGIATPSAQQIGAALTGGTISTALGTTQMGALVNTTTALNTSTVGATAGAAAAGNTVSPAVALQQQRAAAVAGANAARGNVSDTPFPRGISDTPALPVPGVTTGVGGTAATGATAAPQTTAPAAPAATEPARGAPARGGG
jgi:hypothetical protein